MIRFCENADCGRGFVDALPPRKCCTPPTLCPTCRAKMQPLSRLVGGPKGERREPKRVDGAD